MKKISILLFAMLFMVANSFAQLNMSYISQITYNEELNDIWGYAAPDGTEYAIVGTVGGTSIVSLADPNNPTEVAYVSGDNSTWRDIKTWGEFAYITTDTGNDGLTIIDLTNLPDSISTSYLTALPNGAGTLRTCHNIYIDEEGFAYLAGCNVNDGGLIFLDVATEPGVPTLAGLGASVYSHDIYTRNNLAYSSEINLGRFGIYDVSDKMNPVLLGSQNTAANFTHNSWLSDDGNILFTTDETGDAPIGAYDVSDPTDILELDQFRPLETLGTGVIPHNVHVWDDYLIISYYTDGCILVDASRPENLVEVGNFDTFIPASTGFSGAWGAYPFLPSGLVLVSDINTGLYVLEPNYVRACWLEGQVTELATGNPLSDAKIVIEATTVIENSSFSGNYATGYGVPGTYNVVVSKPGFISQTVAAELVSGDITILNVALEAAPSFAISGILRDADSNEPIADGVVNLSNEDFDFNLNTDANGNFNLATFYEGDYGVAAGKWGYKTIIVDASLDENNNSVELSIESGIEDVFSVDLGWEITGSAMTGAWERGVPLGVYFDYIGFLTPDEDTDDLGDHCYVTENSLDLFSGSVTGSTTLTSPVFDPTGFETPYISFQSWVFCVNPNSFQVGDDDLEVVLSNGVGEETIAIIAPVDLEAPSWSLSDINIADIMPLTETMQVSFNTSNFNNDFTEAAIDDFKVYDAGPSGAVAEQKDQIGLKVSPNPSAEEFTVTYKLASKNNASRLVVSNLLGRVVANYSLTENVGKIRFGEDLLAGIYLVHIEGNNSRSKCLKVVKTEP